jgi:large subunit ribosomal protein L13
MIIDARDTILGRLGSFAAKQLLLGNKVDIINCEECIVSGKKQAVMGIYIRKLHRKAPTKAPFFYRRPDMLVKRTIRGMLPFKRARGREAFKNIKCYIGVPENLMNQKALRVEDADIAKMQSTDYMRIKDVCKSIGWKQ